MRKQLTVFLVRWVVVSFGIWLSVRLLGGVVDGREATLWSYIGAGLAFSVINSLLKPIVTILSLPAIILTLGLFIIVVNGLMVYIALLLVPSLSLSFGQAIVAGLILSLINYVVTGLFDMKDSRRPA